MPLQALLSDVDGTLLNTTEFIFQAFEHTLGILSLPCPDRMVLASYAGTPLEQCYQAIAPQTDTALLCSTHRDFQTLHLELLTPFPNTRFALQELRVAGVKIAAITTRMQNGRESLEKAGILSYLDVVITGKDVQHFKPHPEGLLKALAQLNVTPAFAAMVGDTDADVLAGKAAGVCTIAAAYGFFTRDRLEASDPDYIIEDIAQVLEIARK